MLKEKSEVEVNVDGQQAGAQLKELREQARKLNKEYVELSKQKLGNSAEAKKIKKEFDKVEKKIIDVSKKTQDYNKILKNLSGSSIRDLTKLHSHLNAQIKKLGRNTPEYSKAVVELQKVKAEMSAVRKEMNAAVPKTNKFGMSLKSIGANLAGTLGITAGIGMLVGALSSFIKKAEIANALNKKVKNSFDLQGKAARGVTADILALATTFDVDYNEVLQTANTVSKEMGISAKQALSYIEEGFKKGSNNSGEFLDILKEYPTQFREAGIDAKTMFAIINQQVKDGIYSDKGIDAIKEGGLRLRENTKAVQDALKPLDESIKAQIKQEIAAGNSFEAIKLVSEALKDTSLTASETQSIIANVFGGPGEDAGLRYLQTLSDIDTSLENVKNQTSTYKDSTLELSKQYNKLTISVTEGNGIISKSLAGVVDLGTDVLTMLTQFNDRGWSDKLKIIANTFTGMSLLGKKLHFEIGKSAKELTKLTNQHFKIREVAEKKLTKVELAALKKRKDANKRAYKAIQKEKEKQAAKEKAALQKIYDFIEDKEAELADLDPFEKKIAGIDKFYDDLIASAQKHSASENEIAQLNKFRDEEVNRLKLENATKTEQEIFDMKKKYGLLTEDEIMNAEIEAVKKLAEEKILTAEETEQAINNIRNKHAGEKYNTDKFNQYDGTLNFKKIDEAYQAEMKAFENSEEFKTMTLEQQLAARKEIEDKYDAIRKKALDKKADIAKKFIELSNGMIGDAMAGNENAIKDSMINLLSMSLKMLKDQVELAIAGVTIQSLATAGIAGLPRAIILVGLIEAAFAAVEGKLKSGISNGFSSGGYTGSGQTNEVAGVVHKDEYVIPSTMMANTNVQHVVGALETARTGGRLDYEGINRAISKGFAEGGYTGAPAGGSDMLSLESANRLSNAIESLIDKGVPAYVKDNTISDMRKRFKVHEEIERNSSL